jgi:hypothetical protein
VATEAEWASAYLDQAQVELEAARQAIDPSVRAMLLQMTFEKLAKAALLKNGQWSIARAQETHRGATHMMTQLLTRRSLSVLGYNRHVVERVLKPLVDALEELQPAIARSLGRNAGPWLEYPWSTPQNSVTSPRRSLPGLEHYQGRSIRVAQLMRFADVLVLKHDSLFA